jgi:hypothetical protein
MENKLSMPIISVSFKVNELHTLLHQLNIEDSIKHQLIDKINEVHDELFILHNQRDSFVGKLCELANAMSK